MSEDTSVRRLALVTFAIVVAWAASGLLLERTVDATGQRVLGLLTAAMLAALLAFQPRAVRWQTLAVVGVATVGEVVGSLIWGLYEYRLENIPAYVPPGHGLVYLAGVSLATLCGARIVIAVGAVAAATWGLAGLTVLQTTDVAGAIGCAFLVLVLLRTRRPVYAGVYLVVAALELYGTALGTWTWASAVPVLELPQANPPSGVASGYVMFDVVAIWLVARLPLRSTPAPAAVTP